MTGEVLRQVVIIYINKILSVYDNESHYLRKSPQSEDFQLKDNVHVHKQHR